MPTVDFTLEDIAGQTEQIVQSAIQSALVREREYTRGMIQETVSVEMRSLWEHNLSPVLEEIMTGIKGLKRLVDQHSKDIMELRAAR